MDRSELTANVAAGTSVSKSDAASAGGAVFQTIADALAGGEAVTIAALAQALVQGRQGAAQCRQPVVMATAPVVDPLPSGVRTARLRRPKRCVSQRGDGGISAIHRTYQQMRSRARRLNPLARGIFIRTDANFLLRQRCAPLRTSRRRHVPSPLTAPQSSWRNPSRNHSHRRIWVL